MKINAISTLFRTVSGKEYTEYQYVRPTLEFGTKGDAILHFEREIEGRLAIGKWWVFPSLPLDADGVAFEDRNKVGKTDRVWSKNIESYSVTLIEEK